MLLYDLFSKWLWVYPLVGRDAFTAKESLLDFAGPRQFMFGFYSDNAPELIKAAKELSLCRFAAIAKGKERR